MEVQDEMEGRLLLNGVVRKGAAVFELLSGEEKMLLVRRDTFLVLDLCLHVVGGIRRLDLKSDRFPSENLDEDLHTATETEGKVEDKLLLDVVLRKGTPVFMHSCCVARQWTNSYLHFVVAESWEKLRSLVICNHNTSKTFQVPAMDTINSPRQRRWP